MLDRTHPTDPVALAARLSDTLSGHAEEADARGAVAPEAWEALQQSGLLRAPLCIVEGGADLLAPERHAALLEVLRLIGAADLNWARLYEGHINAAGLLRRYGTPAQWAGFAERVQDGALSAVWGADDARGLHARREEGGLRLSGRKILASGAGLVTLPLVTAADTQGPLLLLLDLASGERADLSGWTAQGMRSSASGAIDLEGIFVPADRIIGEPGDFLRQPVLSGGAWRFCAAHLGAAERLVDLFRQGLVARGRGEDPYQLERVAQAVAAVTTAGFWVRRAAALFADASAPAADVVAFVNLTRTVTERAALDVLEIVHRGAGLGSFMRPDPIERIARDLATYLRQPVPDLAMADAARAVLASARPTGALWMPS
jgi:alkylation response protein AidB-like acyl-CoA dehydrogenase